MIQSAFHRTGDHSRRESCPSLRFASARRLGFPVLRASTTTTPFVRLLPLRYDREHDLRKDGSSLLPPTVQAHGQSSGDESPRGPT